MDVSSAVYAYEFANVAVANASVATYAYAIGLVVLVALAIVAGPYAYGFVVFRKKETEKLEKRKTIQNLVVMKDIQ
jgi:hypothetical protein